MKRLVKKKTKTKEWFTVIAPKVFEERVIGRAMTTEVEPLVGRKIVLSLLELTNDFSKYYMKFSFRIKRLEGNKAFSEFDGSECLRDYVSRMVLRRVRRIDVIQDLKTKDGINIRVKGLAVTSRKIKSSVEKVMRARIKDMIKEIVENSTLDEVILGIIDDKIKKEVLQDARKIYPVRNFEVRRTEVLKQ